MPEYTDKYIPIECGECSEVREGIVEMTNHILKNHKEYSLAEADNLANVWADDAYYKIDDENAYRADYFRRHGEDPFEPRSDQDYGN